MMMGFLKIVNNVLFNAVNVLEIVQTVVFVKEIEDTG